ncbi:hypothetical protein C8J57DRAFT_1234758 [Mycena rebaudengoi]|nr:hypothetical protein C8J57DRAFT_1234758 [Mycena rebaudengoi]
MPPTKGPLWAFFYEGRKRNSSHSDAYCCACIDLHRPASAPIPIDVDSDGEDSVSPKQLLGEEWFKKACEKVPAILGEKKAMIAHLIGAKACKNASSRAKAIAKKIKNEGKRPKAATEDDSDSNSSRPSKRKQIAAVEKAMKQMEL